MSPSNGMRKKKRNGGRKTVPEPSFTPGPIPGMPCGGKGCFLHPVANLASRFALRVARGHGGSLGRAAFSGIELMKAMRDFLDEEIAFAERTAGRPGSATPGYEKIPVE